MGKNVFSLIQSKHVASLF